MMSTKCSISWIRFQSCYDQKPIAWNERYIYSASEINWYFPEGQNGWRKWNDAPLGKRRRWYEAHDISLSEWWTMANRWMTYARPNHNTVEFQPSLAYLGYNWHLGQQCATASCHARRPLHHHHQRHHKDYLYLTMFIFPRWGSYGTFEQ